MAETTQTVVLVSQRAVIQRINRALSKEGSAGRVLKTLRGDRGFSDLGRHYVIDVDQNRVVSTHVNLEEYARELRVLQGWERVEA